MDANSGAELAAWQEAALREGIAAAQAGETATARRFLTQVVEADEHNEQAWLWLAEVVSTPEERSICLENVLALNPQNFLARQSLEELDKSAPAAGTEIVVRKEYAPISPAAALLHPESRVLEWRYRDPTTVQQAPAVSIASSSAFTDVWSEETAVCAYCAAKIDEDATRCHNCGRSLQQKRFRYPNPSANLHVLWVLLAGLGQLFLIQGIYAVVIERVLLGAISAGLLLALFLILAAGVYYRRSWAHLGAIGATSLFLLAALIRPLLPIDFHLLDIQLTGIDPFLANFLGAFAQNVAQFIRAMQLGAAGLVLGYAIFGAGPDFAREEEQLIARLDKGLQYASDYHAAARKHAQAGRLATAVLHWQRAAAKEPHQTQYLRFLSLAYARLGFYERSLDALNSALRLTTNQQKRAELQQLINTIARRKVDG